VAVPRDLPKAVDWLRVKTVLTVDLSGSGELMVDGAPVTLDELAEGARKAVQANPELRAVIRADKSANYASVVRLMDTLKRAGIDKLAFGCPDRFAGDAAAGAKLASAGRGGTRMHVPWTEMPIRRDRVRDHTAPVVNRKLDLLTAGNIDRYRDAPQEELIRRLAELDTEWDVDRALMANFAVLGSVSLGLALRHKAWIYVFGSQMGFLLLHAVMGWCPPASVFRRLGYRTSQEIEMERRALLELLAHPTQQVEPESRPLGAGI
jgi:hypothetical protein